MASEDDGTRTERFRLPLNKKFFHQYRVRNMFKWSIGDFTRGRLNISSQRILICASNGIFVGKTIEKFINLNTEYAGRFSINNEDLWLDVQYNINTDRLCNANYHRNYVFQVEDLDLKTIGGWLWRYNGFNIAYAKYVKLGKKQSEYNERLRLPQVALEQERILDSALDQLKQDELKQQRLEQKRLEQYNKINGMSFDEILDVMRKKIQMEQLVLSIAKINDDIGIGQSALSVAEAELEKIPQNAILPEVRCPACLIDFDEIPNKIVMLGCGSHMICIDCVNKLQKCECLVCKTPFVRENIKVNTWFAKLVRDDAFFAKKQQCTIIRKMLDMTKNQLATQQSNYRGLLNGDLNDEMIIQKFKENSNSSKFLQKLVSQISS
jgi:hypothetical protein